MYYVLHFVNENVVESVPSTWVEKKDGKTFCRWPKKIAGDKITKLIKNGAVPSQSWDLCLCTVKYICSSYEDSRAKCQEAAYLTFTEASSEEEICNQSLSDGSTSSVSLPQSPPRKKTKKSNTNTVCALSSASDVPNQNELIIKLSALDEKLEYITKISLESFAKLHKEILDCKEEIKLLKQSSQIRKSLPGKNLFPMLPLSTLEDLNKFEDDLKNDATAQNLVSYLCSFGSPQMRTAVHQIMKRVVTNEVAVQFSLHGKGGKKTFIDLDLCTCVRGKV